MYVCNNMYLYVCSDGHVTDQETDQCQVMSSGASHSPLKYNILVTRSHLCIYMRFFQAQSKTISSSLFCHFTFCQNIQFNLTRK